MNYENVICLEIKDDENRDWTKETTNFQTNILPQIVHAARCSSQECASAHCIKFRCLFSHFEACKKRRAEGCGQCEVILRIYGWHSALCDTYDCPAPGCQEFKMLNCVNSLVELSKEAPRDSNKRKRSPRGINKKSKLVLAV